MAISFDPLLYVSPGLKSKKLELAEKLMLGKKLKDLYLICKNTDTGVPEAIKSEMLDIKYYRDRDIVISGITDNYDSALEYLAVYAYENLVPEGNGQDPHK
ncbi:MAG: hypothetical protein K5686_08700 [Lachnospiraceae bacterium]|nr:hypothetical protein [Lachnospiraceae bacterium]